jgi:hypothetical protein
MKVQLPQNLENKQCYQCVRLMNQLHCYKIKKKYYQYIDESVLICVPSHIPNFLLKPYLYLAMLPVDIKIW